MKLSILLFTALAFQSPLSHAFTLNGTSGLVGWPDKTLAIHYNAANCSISEAKLTQAIDTAVNLWNTVPTSGITLKRGDSVGVTVQDLFRPFTGGDKPINPVIICDTNFSATLEANASSIPAATWTDGEGYQLNYAFIILNAERGKAANLKNLDDTQLGIVFAHEIGHVLGLGHTSDTTALMYFSSSYKENLALSQDDIDGITYLYPRREPFGNKALGCATITSLNSSGGGGGSEGMLQVLLFVLIAGGAVSIQKRRSKV